MKTNAFKAFFLAAIASLAFSCKDTKNDNSEIDQTGATTSEMEGTDMNSDGTMDNTTGTMDNTGTMADTTATGVPNSGTTNGTTSGNPEMP